MDDAQDEDVPDEHTAHEMRTYLNTFNKEILAASNDEETEKSEEDVQYKEEPQKFKKSQDVLMYFASTDGMLYATNTVQGSLPQPATLPSDDKGNGTNNEGLQHIVVALGETGNLVLSDQNALSYTLPSAGARQNFVIKQNHNPVADSMKTPVMVVQPTSTDMGQENVVPSKSSTSNESSKVGNELSNNFPQIYQIIPSEGEPTAAKESTVVNGNVIPLIAGNSYQTVNAVPSDTNPGQLNYVLFVSNMEGFDATVGTEAKILTVDGEIADEKTNVLKAPSDRSIVEYTCPCCDYTSSKRYLLSRHMKCHSDERPHKCEVCGRGFKTVASLQNHMNTHTKTKPHPCRECASSFTTSGELVRHMRYKHTHERPHRCPECDYASVELSKLKRHMRCHTGERPYQCPHCTYASPDTYKLKRHLRTHTGEKPYACDVCQARFTQSNSLKAHRLIHSGNKPAYQCVYCPATCGRKTDLRIHMQKLHSSNKMHTCKRCGKMFKDKYSFKVHCKTHDGERTFNCTDCPFVTFSLQQFEAHVTTHGNEGLYQCTKCSENFSHKQLLTQHINFCHESKDVSSSSKAKDIECPECGKAFRYHVNMVRHTAIHDPDASAEKQEEAMQIGRPKEQGELQDGEEDELSNEENFENDQDLLELVHVPTFSDGENKVLSMANGQLLTLAGSNSEYRNNIPHSSGENMQTVICSFSDAVKVDDGSQAPLRIEYDEESLDSSVGGNQQQ